MQLAEQAHQVTPGPEPVDRVAEVAASSTLSRHRQQWAQSVLQEVRQGLITESLPGLEAVAAARAETAVTQGLHQLPQRGLPAR